MTDVETQRRKTICEIAGVDDIGDLSDGFHTFNSLYEQRMILFAALVKVYKDKAWKSYRHEDGEYCFGGGWFIVGIDTPEGSYTYHYENKYFDLFDCEELTCGKHWDGHTEKDVTRLMSLEPEQRWISCSEQLPQYDETVLICFDPNYCDKHNCIKVGHLGVHDVEDKLFQKIGEAIVWYTDNAYYRLTSNAVIAWMPKPEPYRGEGEQE